uniref:Uncharacterized protein n=1 Tax=Bruguiera gymnorhiza TaxID=39984 RepID=B1Q4V0_BRUGY|nr:hypothetical protein [Bruguiera gymnorhiza]
MSPGGSYTRAQYTDAIQAKIGNLSVFFRCMTTKNHVELLQEVFVCVDKSAQNFIGCVKSRDNCKTNAIKLADRVELLQGAAQDKDTEL